jgi:uncharacterized coiled-coil protein SlyX
MRKEAILWSCAALLVFGSMSLAGQARPYLGVGLDSAPLPELLTKHLRLDPDQGVRISNIMTDSPADQAGLERDDLIIAFGGHKLAAREQLIDAVHQASVGTEMTLEVIHLGERKTVSLKLGTAPETVQWKYPPEPDVVTSWRPGKIFKIGPDGRDMIEIPFDKIPGADLDVKKFFQESYTYHHTTGGEEYTITVEGDPADKDARVIVHAGDKEYSTSAGDLEALPEKYRGPAKEALEDARTSVKTDIRIRGFDWPEAFGPEARRKLFQNLPRPDLERLSQEKDRALEKLQEQMEHLQQRMKEMEEHNRQMLDKLLHKNDSSSTTAEPQKSTPAETAQKPAI